LILVQNCTKGYGYGLSLCRFSTFVEGLYDVKEKNLLPDGRNEILQHLMPECII
jgi:hypothetical protein